jgi:hypothetical protein
MTDDGPISWFLGVRLVQDVAAGTFSLDQATSVRHILAEYRMDECKPVSTPSEGVLRHSANDLTPEDRLFMQDKDYRSLVGKLLYLLFTRPDIAFAVNQLTRHLNNPGKVHWVAAMRVLKYLRGTASLGLTYRREEETKGATIIGFADADWAGDTETRRSTSGSVFMLGGAAISWRTKLQRSVALSTCEAELMSLSAALQEAIWLRRLSKDLHLTSAQEPMTLFEDNQGAIALINDFRFSERTKHVDIRYFFIREKVAEGEFKVEYCTTALMLADIFTKALGRIAFERIRAFLGLSDLEM